MKKIKTLLVLLVVFCAGLCGCNRQVFDTTYKFTTAYVQLPNGEVVYGKVDSWLDFEDGDQLQVKINGVTYLTHADNVVLIAE